jgi:hypothetical protein
MNKKLISNLMHTRVSGLKSSAGYFFRGDFEDVLSGVLLEYVPSGLYIYDFKFPLFDSAGPNLTYSDRLVGRDFIGKGEMSEQAVVDYILASPEAVKTFMNNAPLSVSEFVDYLVESNKCVRSPHARLIYASALILLGEESRAADILDELPPMLHRTDVPHCHLLSNCLRQGSEAARTLLDQTKEKNLHAFGLA